MKIISTKHNNDCYVFYAEDGGKHSVGRDVGTEEDALEILIGGTIPTAKYERITAIKSEAQAKIYARVPVWKQANYNARMNELNMIRFEREWTEKELSEIAVMATAWADVKKFRLDSDTAETAVNAAGTIAEINAVQF